VKKVLLIFLIFLCKPALADEWHVECKIDHITDKKLCILQKDSFWLFRNENMYFIKIGDNNYPGTQAILKTEYLNHIYTSNQDGIFDVPDFIIYSMKRSKNIKTRFQRWPSLAYLDNTINLNGFNKKLNEMDLMYKKLK